MLKSKNDLRKKCTDILKKNENSDVDFEFMELFQFVFGQKYSDFSDCKLDESKIHELKSICEKRKDGYPLQYILGSWDFMDLTLSVGPGVLIPRQDTESVCRTAIKHIKKLAAPTVLDLCSGSGAIALAIKKHCPNATVLALEKDKDAFKYLKRNIEKTNLQVLAINEDVFKFDYAIESQSFDLIISNPPYIDENLKGTLQKELSFEPEQALYAGQRGLRFYDFIAQYYHDAIKDNGYLIFECGYDQFDNVKSIMLNYGYTFEEQIKDLAGNNRGIVCKAQSKQDKIL
jgi:release factor glutamine methyltransferase